MWQRPWRYKEGIAIGAGLVVIGCLLQLTVGAIDWSLFAYPANLVVLCIFLLTLVAIYALRHRVYLFTWLCQYSAAVTAIAWTVVMTVIMGCIKQVPAHHAPTDSLGFSRMIASWPFVLVYLWLTSVLGLTIIKYVRARKKGMFLFLLNHLGLFIAMVAATLGSADIQRLKMTTKLGETEWRAEDETGTIKELPLAIELKDFKIDEYPPKLMLIDNATGLTLPKESPTHILLEEGTTAGQLLDWQITVEKSVPMAAMVSTADTVNYVAFYTRGATYAVYLKAVNNKQHLKNEGWVSNGSMLFPYKPLRLDTATSIVMPEREPQRFASCVKVYTQKGDIKEDTIEVNKPMSIAGWKIYQLSYDEQKGRWSDISVFELVRDPWLPAVYAGIIMMLVGAVGLFLNAQKRKETIES